MAGFKRDRCVVAVSSAAMSDVKFWDAGGGILPLPASSVKPWTPVRLAAMSDWRHGSCSAAASCRGVIGPRGCSSCEVRYSLTNVTRSCGEAASCPVDLKLFIGLVLANLLSLGDLCVRV